MFKQRGFTLIELMIVVAIIGILATIAIPSFMSFRSKSFRAEAKVQLGAIAVTEKAFFTERSTYTDSLARLGWVAEGSPRFIYGFTTDAVPTPSGANDSAELVALGAASFSTALMRDAFGVPLVSGDLPASPVTATSYVIGAAGNIDSDAGLDLWTLDSDGALTNVSNDL